MTWRGKLEHVDLGAGAWVLVTDDGKRLALDGAVPPGLDGAVVEVEGAVSGGFGFLMTGDPTVRVTRVRRA